jgi:predicted DNA-binding transcriptional regulator AlpA
MDVNHLPEGFSRVEKVAKRYDSSPKTVWRWAKDDANSFPKPYKLSAGVTAWKNSELAEWEKSRTNKRLNYDF